MTRAINSTAISMGLVTIPCKVYTATKSKDVSFCQLTNDLHRVKQQWVDAVTDQVVERPFKRGFEYIKPKKNQPGQVVEITDEELESLGPKDHTKAIDIKEFVKADSLSLLSVEKIYYLGPDTAGERGYALFAQVMRDKNVVALAEWTVRGKTQLVALRPYEGGLILQQLFFSDEINDLAELELPKTNASQPEIDMAGQFVDAMTTDAYDPSKYKNEYAARVSALVDKKVNGETIDVTVPAAPPQNLMDMFAQLKASVDQIKSKTG
jgi:DNA end-binding protein Ku